MQRKDIVLARRRTSALLLQSSAAEVLSHASQCWHRESSVYAPSRDDLTGTVVSYRAHNIENRRRTYASLANVDVQPLVLAEADITAMRLLSLMGWQADSDVSSSTSGVRTDLSHTFIRRSCHCTYIRSCTSFVVWEPTASLIQVRLNYTITSFRLKFCCQLSRNS